jgi:hypothetical protein
MDYHSSWRFNQNILWVFIANIDLARMIGPCPAIQVVQKVISYEDQRATPAVFLRG